MAGKKKKTVDNNTIAVNKRAFHDYHIESKIQSGVVLQGWEVKSMRQGRAQISEGYVIIKKGEAWLIGANIVPLTSASTHVVPDSGRTRKLLLTRKEIENLRGLIERKGHNLVPLSLYWKANKVKLEIGLAKGKKKYDKRQAEKDHQWNRQKERLLKHKN